MPFIQELNGNRILSKIWNRALTLINLSLDFMTSLVSVSLTHKTIVLSYLMFSFCLPNHPFLGFNLHRVLTNWDFEKEFVKIRSFWSTLANFKFDLLWNIPSPISSLPWLFPYCPFLLLSSPPYPLFLWVFFGRGGGGLVVMVSWLSSSM